MKIKNLKQPRAFQANVANTIYDIVDDYDLEGGSITIPANCTLNFMGGSIYNGTIVYNNTRLEGSVQAFCYVVGTISNEIVYTKWFHFNGYDLSDLINSLIADNKRIVVEKGTYTTTKCIEVNTKREIEIDFSGATVVDNTQGHHLLLGGICNPFCFVVGSSSIKIHDLYYELAGSREYSFFNGDEYINLFTSFHIGDYGPNAIYEPNNNIELFGINANVSVGISSYCCLIGIVGNSYNVAIHDCECDGNLLHFVNFEWSLKPDTSIHYEELLLSLPNYYGMMPFNCRVYNIVGKNAPNSEGYIRYSGSYNVAIENCYGYNVACFINLFAGDYGIMRCQGCVVVNQCKTYYDEYYDGDDPSIYVGIPQNSFDNHEIRRFFFQWSFINCEFQAGNSTLSGIVRLEGNGGKTIFHNCVFNNSGIDARNVYHYGFDNNASSLRVLDCQFINCKRALFLFYSHFVQIDGCRFISEREDLIQDITNSQIVLSVCSAIDIRNCMFKYLGTNVNSFIGVCGDCDLSLYSDSRITISNCSFSGHSVPAINNSYHCLVNNCSGGVLIYNDNNHYSDDNKCALITLNNYVGDTLDSKRSSYYRLTAGGPITIIGVVLSTTEQIIIDKVNSAAITFVNGANTPAGVFPFTNIGGQNLEIIGQALIRIFRVDNSTAIVDYLRKPLIVTGDYSQMSGTFPNQGLVFDKSLSQLLYREYQDFVTVDGYSPAPRSGAFVDKPTSRMNGTSDIGFTYYDTTNHRPIYWGGSSWFTVDGINLGV